MLLLLLVLVQAVVLPVKMSMSFPQTLYTIPMTPTATNVVQNMLLVTREKRETWAKRGSVEKRVTREIRVLREIKAIRETRETREIKGSAANRETREIVASLA
jgi:hypothetical protein